jgi:branched-chain amino acid transport system permease protein
VSPLQCRVLAFAISGFVAGIAGALYLSVNQSISPSVMGLTPMSIDVTMLVIGGLGTVYGPVIGTALLAVVQSLLISHPGIELTILGTFLLIVVVFVPNGVVGLIGRLRGRVAAWVEADAGPPSGSPTEPDEPAETADPGQPGPPGAMSETG